LPVVTQPIETADLPLIGQFLNQNLNRRISAERWAGALRHDWAVSRPNHGMQLLDDGRLVGVFCAIYSDQTIGGKVERFCNPHSWCVLDSHRQHGITPLLRILKQPGYHFTMFTPNPTVTKVFRGLRFRDLDDRQYVVPCIPGLAAGLSGAFVERDSERIAGRLSPEAASDYKAHASIPWLEFLAFGRNDDTCLVVYKRIRLKRLPCAWIMHVSDAAAFDRNLDVLRTHLAFTQGIASLQIEARWLDSRPRLAIPTRRTQPKLYLSSRLNDSQVRDLYSELVALDV